MVHKIDGPKSNETNFDSGKLYKPSTPIGMNEDVQRKKFSEALQAGLAGNSQMVAYVPSAGIGALLNGKSTQPSQTAFNS